MAEVSAKTRENVEIQGLDHVGIVVPDLEVAMRFYAQDLGLPLMSHGEIPGTGVRVVYLGREGGLVQLLEPSGDSPLAKSLDNSGEGLHHICFSVANIREFVAGLTQEGLPSRIQGGAG